MKHLRTIVIVTVVVIASILTLIYFLNRPPKNKDHLNLYGNVDVRQVDISFRIPGQVTELFFEEGDLVKKGDLLARLDKAPYDNQVREAIAYLNVIKANLDNAQKLLKRRQELIAEGGVSVEDVDNAMAARSELHSQFEQAEAALLIALDQLSYTEVLAPADGVILTRIREPGTVVKEADPVFTLSISSPVWIRAFVNEPQLGDIYYGMQATIFTDTPGLPEYTGKIGFISPVAEFTPKTVETTQLRTDLVYRLRIYVDNPDHYLKQGMPVTICVKTKKEQ